MALDGGEITSDAGVLLLRGRAKQIRFFHRLRCLIALKQQKRAAQFCGEVEVGESYFGGYRKGRRGRGAAGKVIVSGL